MPARRAERHRRHIKGVAGISPRQYPKSQPTQGRSPPRPAPRPAPLDHIPHSRDGTVDRPQASEPFGRGADDRVFFRDIKPYEIVDHLDQLRGPAGGVVALSHSVLWAPGALLWLCG